MWGQKGIEEIPVTCDDEGGCGIETVSFSFLVNARDTFWGATVPSIACDIRFSHRLLFPIS